MSNRPAKKKKKDVVEITEDDFNVEWTPPRRTARDRIIQIGVFILIVAFLLPAITCASGRSADDLEAQNGQQVQQDPLEQQIKLYSEQVAQNPKDPAALANLGLYTTFKAAQQTDENEKMTLLATSEKYLRDALAQDPNYALATRELARNLYIQKKEDQAKEVIGSALAKADEKLGSKDETEVNDAKSMKVELLGLAAAISADQGKKEDALKQLGEAIDLKPGEPSLYLSRAQFHLQFNDRASAEKDLTMAVDIGQKIGDQQAVAQGQQLLEMLNTPMPSASPAAPQTPAPAQTDSGVEASPSPAP